MGQEPPMIEDAVIINFLLSLFFIMLIFYLDRFEQESLWSMTRVFFLAILATYGFTVLKLKIGGNQPFSPLVSAYIEAGFFEELLKFGLLALVIFLFKEVDEPFGLVLYAGLIALGFSFFENIGYFLRATQLGSLWEAQTRDSLPLQPAAAGHLGGAHHAVAPAF